MRRHKMTAAAALLLSLGLFVFCGCARKQPQQEQEPQRTESQRGPLDVDKVSYLVHSGDPNHVELYIITSDLKVTCYSIDPEDGSDLDYLEGELPSEDRYDVSEFEISETSWSSMVNVLTRVDFMNLSEELPAPEGTYDAAAVYIRVETSGEVHTSGGYAAGTSSDDSDHQRFAEARQYIDNALNDN